PRPSPRCPSLRLRGPPSRTLLGNSWAANHWPLAVASTGPTSFVVGEALSKSSFVSLPPGFNGADELRRRRGRGRPRSPRRARGFNGADELRRRRAARDGSVHPITVTLQRGR